MTNNLKWLELMGEQKHKLGGGFRGIVLTGWQRYDHFAVLCELLPAGLPSLAVNLLATSHGYFNNSLSHKLYRGLQCGDNIQSAGVDLVSDRRLWDKMRWCMFPGAAFFKLTKSFTEVEKEVREYLEKLDMKRGWLTQYNRRHNFSSPFRYGPLF